VNLIYFIVARVAKIMSSAGTTELPS